jgi:hypothetical protein
MQYFCRRTSEDDTPGEITGGLPKMHLAELSAKYTLHWTGSQYMVQVLFRMYTNELYNSIQKKKFLLS